MTPIVAHSCGCESVCALEIQVVTNVYEIVFYRFILLCWYVIKIIFILNKLVIFIRRFQLENNG